MCLMAVTRSTVVASATLGHFPALFLLVLPLDRPNLLSYHPQALQRAELLVKLSEVHRGLTLVTQRSKMPVPLRSFSCRFLSFQEGHSAHVGMKKVILPGLLVHVDHREGTLTVSTFILLSSHSQNVLYLVLTSVVFGNCLKLPKTSVIRSIFNIRERVHITLSFKTGRIHPSRAIVWSSTPSYPLKP